MGASTSPYGAHLASTIKEFNLGVHQGLYTCHQGSCPSWFNVQGI